MSQTVTGEGASTDTIVEIDVSKPYVKWQYGCPNGHSTIQETNGGIWCRSCSRDPEIEDPHHTEVLDKKREELIPWERVRVVGDD